MCARAHAHCVQAFEHSLRYDVYAVRVVAVVFPSTTITISSSHVAVLHTVN